jgi:ferredoxin
MKGDYFVSKDCIGCEACVSTLPEIFGSGKEKAYVMRQPKTQREKEDCAEMKDSCPAEAIKRKSK